MDQDRAIRKPNTSDLDQCGAIVDQEVTNRDQGKASTDQVVTGRDLTVTHWDQNPNACSKRRSQNQTGKYKHIIRQLKDVTSGDLEPLSTNQDEQKSSSENSVTKKMTKYHLNSRKKQHVQRKCKPQSADQKIVI